MRNKYGGDCYKCGLWVAPGTGHFERVHGQGWRVQHALHRGRDAVTCDMAIAKGRVHKESAPPNYPVPKAQAIKRQGS